MILLPPDDRLTWTSAAWQVLAVGTLLTLCDALVYSGEAPARWAELFGALRPLALTAAATCAVAALLWSAIVGGGGRWLPRGPLTWGLAAAVGLAYVLEFVSIRPRAGILAVVIPYGLLAGLAAHRWWSSGGRRIVGRIAACLPAGALAGLVGLWAQKSLAGAGAGTITAIDPSWVQWAAMTAAWVGTTGGLTWLTGRWPALIRVSIAGTATLAIAASALTPLVDRGIDPHSEPHRGNDIPLVILIFVDALRTDALACYGNDAIDTPAFDRLAADSVVFERAVAPSPWTVPSMATVMTGVSPWVHRVTKPSRDIPDALPTLAERMRAGRYTTAAIGRNKFLCRGRFERGFERFEFYPRRRAGSPIADTLGRAWRKTRREEGSTEDLATFATRWLTDHRDEDAFLWLHFFDPHMPYDPGAELLPDGKMPPRIGPRFSSVRAVRAGRFVPTPDEKAWIEGLYLGEVRLVDAHLGRLLDHLQQLGLYDDALIVLTSDHGEEFWEHDGWEHGHTLYDEVLRVPLMVKLPGAARSDRVQAPVALGSLMPTLLQLCGLTREDELFSYPSLAPMLHGDGGPAAAQFATAKLYYEPQDAVTFDGFKYIRGRNDDRELLFHLTVDPGEQRDVAEDHPQLLDRASGLLDGYEKGEAALRRSIGASDRESPLDSDTEKHLRSLGYIE